MTNRNDVQTLTCNVQRVIMLSSLAHVFNANVLGAVIQSNISDG